MSEEQTVRVFFTPDPEVLTLGIREVQAVVRGDVAVILDRGLVVHGEGRSWHRYRNPAIRRAHAIRMAAIARHEAEIEALKALDFGASQGGFRG